MVPVLINTYYPPNAPLAKRVYAFGQALREAIESWDSDKTVAIIASGGLSHFVIDEELDWQILNGIKNKTPESLISIGQDKLKSGSSEIRNWIAAAGAMPEMDFHLIDYIPTYRSLAGTGCGMAFGYWTP